MAGHKHLNVRAELVNEGFANYVGRLKPNSDMLSIFHAVLQDIRGDQVKLNNTEADKVQVELDKVNERINRVNDMFFDGEISRAEQEKNLARYICYGPH